MSMITLSDGNLAVSYTYSSYPTIYVVRIYNLKNGNLMFSLPVSSYRLNIAPDITDKGGFRNSLFPMVEVPGGMIAIGEYDGSIKIWSTINGSLILNIPAYHSTLSPNGHSKGIYTLALLSNGNMLSGSVDLTVKMWNPQNGNFISTFETGLTMIGILQNGNFATNDVNNPANIKIWNSLNNTAPLITLDNSKCICTRNPCKNQIYKFLTLPNGDLVTGDYEGVVRIWNLIDRTNFYFPSPNLYSPNGKLLQCQQSTIYSLALTTTGYLVVKGFSVAIYDINQKKMIFNDTIVRDKKADNCECAALPDGNVACFGLQGLPSVYILNPITGNITASLRHGYMYRTSDGLVKVFPNGRIVSLGGMYDYGDGLCEYASIRVWDIYNPPSSLINVTPAQVFNDDPYFMKDNGHNYIFSIAGLSNGNIATGTLYGSLVVWNPTSNGLAFPAQKIIGPGRDENMVYALKEVNKKLIALHPYYLRVIDIDNGLQSFPNIILPAGCGNKFGPDFALNSQRIAILKTGNLLITCSGGYVIYNLTTGSLVSRINYYELPNSKFKEASFLYLDPNVYQPNDNLALSDKDNHVTVLIEPNTGNLLCKYYSDANIGRARFSVVSGLPFCNSTTYILNSAYVSLRYSTWKSKTLVLKNGNVLVSHDWHYLRCVRDQNSNIIVRLIYPVKCDSSNSIIELPNGIIAAIFSYVYDTNVIDFYEQTTYRLITRIKEPGFNFVELAALPNGNLAASAYNFSAAGRGLYINRVFLYNIQNLPGYQCVHPTNC